MKTTSLFHCLCLLCFVPVLYSCKKSLSPNDLSLQSQTKATTGRAGNLAASVYGDCNFTFIESSLTSAGWTKVFEDEFNKDLSQWNIWTGGAYNNELQYYQAANLSLLDGKLLIEAKRQSIEGRTLPADPTLKKFAFTSGRIESKTHFSASATVPKVRIMAKIMLPAGIGMWPAFWAYGDPWPTQGEIDIMEARGNEPLVYHTAYWYGRKSGVNQASGTEAHIHTVSLTDCWHIYEVIWEKDRLTFLLDGVVVDTKTGGLIPNFFRKSERVTLNLAVGGNFFGSLDPSSIQPGTLQVDWVKVFTAKK